MAATPAFMVQGTGSNVGKSLMVAGLARVFARMGYKVRPFKPQNMSNNAGVAADGGEIGRAQSLQARAARIVPMTDMNPVLLKPEGETGAQVIVHGKRVGSMKARDFGAAKKNLLPVVMESYARLSRDADLVICEGAGSPAEINLRDGDIANMGFAEAAEVPVVLVGDIDRGGVIAALVGTKNILTPDDAARIRGFIVNRFRGEMSLFTDAADYIVAETGWRNLGIVPHFDGARLLPAEDSLDLESKAGGNDGGGKFHVAAPVFPRIANFDDFDPLHADPAIRFSLVRGGDMIPLDADLVLLPGSKAVMADLAFLKEQGWDTDMAALLRHNRRGLIMGLCGGYQMLGRVIHDPDGIEGAAGSMAGLGLLDVETTLGAEKSVGEVTGVSNDGVAVKGYEIHLGHTTGGDCARPMLMRDDKTSDGAISADGRVMGCYMHGIFVTDAYRGAWLGGGGGSVNFDGMVEAAIDGLADHLEARLDIGAIAEIAGLK